MVYKTKGSEKKMNNRKNLSMLVALFLVMMTASSVVSGDGTDPLDPSDGGADWDGDGLTNAEEQSAGTDMTKADSDGDGLPDGWEVRNGLNPNNGGDANSDADNDGLSAAQDGLQSFQKRRRQCTLPPFVHPFFLFRAFIGIIRLYNAL